MLSSVLGALGDRVDSRFMTAYWLPAFVFALGGLGVLALLLGPGQIDAWVSGLDSVEQTLGVLIIVLIVSMLAFVLRAVTHPITEVFAGTAIPRSVAAWSTRRQLRTRLRSERLLGADDGGAAPSPAAAAAQWLGRRFPVDDADMKPTLFGNVLASVGEHPRFAYSMEGALWWPRLAPLLPSAFQDALTGALAPMIALLNLSAVFFALGVLALLLGPLGSLWAVALAALGGAIVLSWLGYRAAVSQATEVGKMLCVAFDLYRYDILDQLGLDHPPDLAAERALWLRLTREVLGLPETTSSPGVGPGDRMENAGHDTKHPGATPR